jgi:tRNA threonylcarbamoyladenosine biosynthesis protein TsaE
LDPPAIFQGSFLSRSAAETVSFAAALGRTLAGGEILGLVGDLGCGKTTFTKGLSLGLGLEDARLVSSPTYVLEQVYPTRIPLHHYDAYRLSSDEEFLELGFEERLREGDVLVVEWADKVLRVLPPDTLIVRLSLGCVDEPTVRRVVLSGPAGKWRERLIRLFPGTR